MTHRYTPTNLVFMRNPQNTYVLEMFTMYLIRSPKADVLHINQPQGAMAPFLFMFRMETFKYYISNPKCK